MQAPAWRWLLPSKAIETMAAAPLLVALFDNYGWLGCAAGAGGALALAALLAQGLPRETLTSKEHMHAHA